jgi:hypothetical protein
MNQSLRKVIALCTPLLPGACRSISVRGTGPLSTPFMRRQFASVYRSSLHSRSQLLSVHIKAYAQSRGVVTNLATNTYEHLDKPDLTEHYFPARHAGPQYAKSFHNQN